MKIGILREGKIPIDRRVPLTPLQCKEILSKYPNVSILVQASPLRCFIDDEYRTLNIAVNEDISDCDLLLGVKEVQIPDLIQDKKYIFFSHVIKKQLYNKELLRAILKKNIQLIDWECLTNKNGERIIAFGRYAGIVGAYNGILVYGKKFKLFDIKPANKCRDLNELKQEYKKVKLPNIKLVVTGGGRVAKGAIEVLEGMNIRKMEPDEFLKNSFDTSVYTQLRSKDYNKRKIQNPKSKIRNSKFEIRNPKFAIRNSKSNWDSEYFYKNPREYESTFDKYTYVTDLLIATAYWDTKAPVLFTAEDMKKNGFKISVIADVTCDIDGSIASTKKFSTIDDPVYDYNPLTGEIEPPFSKKTNISVMAIANLPCELPKDASKDFGTEMINNVLPNILGGDKGGLIERATIAKGGKLTSRYAYLKDYVEVA